MLIVLIALLPGARAEECAPDCTSEIYCSSDLLHDVQMSRVFNSSKTFVDMRLLFPEEEILNKYRNLRQNRTPSVEILRNFVQENFADDDLDLWTPPDYTEQPKSADSIVDPVYRQLFLNITKKWKNLGTKTSERIRDNQTMYSRIYLPNGYIKSGASFAELYYWDMYWIVKGLLVSDMVNTARGIIENELYLLKTMGYIPTANRLYYQRRSQPPLLILTIAAYLNHTDDIEFLRVNINTIEAEFKWWLENRMTTVRLEGIHYLLAQYKVESCTPRPENYFEDYTLSQNITNKVKLYTALKSASESGWSSSTRNVRNPSGDNKGAMSEFETQNLLHVDLNAVLQYNAKMLSIWMKLTNNLTMSEYYGDISDSLVMAIEKVFWNEREGMWLDFDTVLLKSRNFFYASNMIPLFTESYDEIMPQEQVLNYLLRHRICDTNFTLLYQGIPASTSYGYKWDFPNIWPPLNWFTIQSLWKSKNQADKDMALQLAKKFIDTVYLGLNGTGYLYEKYDAFIGNVYGISYETEPDKEHGWTIGTCLDLLHTFGPYLNYSST